jgi:hypothetical protein
MKLILLLGSLFLFKLPAHSVPTTVPEIAMGDKVGGGGSDLGGQFKAELLRIINRVDKIQKAEGRTYVNLN